MLKNFLLLVLLAGITVASFFIGNVLPVFNIIFYVLFGAQILFVLSWFLIGCYNVIKMDMIGHKNYVIFKNFHVTLFKIPNIILYFKMHKLIQRQFVIDESCKYNIPEQGINKLFGLSFGMHHKNSIRFGWKYNATDISSMKLNSIGMSLFQLNKQVNEQLFSNNTVEIYAYLYINGVRTEQKICDVNINQLYTYYIEYYIANRSTHIVNMWVRSNVDITNGIANYKKYTFNLPNTLPKWGYSLFPYFGGEFKAPHKMKIKEIFY